MHYFLSLIWLRDADMLTGSFAIFRILVVSRFLIAQSPWTANVCRVSRFGHRRVISEVFSSKQTVAGWPTLVSKRSFTIVYHTCRSSVSTLVYMCVFGSLCGSDSGPTFLDTVPFCFVGLF